MENMLFEVVIADDQQPATWEPLCQTVSRTITAIPVMLSQSQHLVMLLFSDAIAARKIKLIITAKKIIEDIQWFIEAPLSVSSRHILSIRRTTKEFNSRSLVFLLRGVMRLRMSPCGWAVLPHREVGPGPHAQLAGPSGSA
jgi:hypothetical protein